MKPPECDVCGGEPRRDAEGLDGFETVTFADHEPLPEGMTGHPRGVHWLCAPHAAAAADLTHLTWASALPHLRAEGPGLIARALARVRRPGRDQ